MKFGFRKPSIKKSIKARTTGRIKRSVKKTVNPLYGKKGIGFIKDPKKAVYNKVYNKTTFGLSDIFKWLKPNKHNKNKKKETDPYYNYPDDLRAFCEYRDKYQDTWNLYGNYKEQINHYYYNYINSNNHDDFNKLLTYCQKYTEILPKIEEAKREDSKINGTIYKEDKYSLVHHRLSMAYEKAQCYNSAINVCEEAISKGYTDGTKGGFEARINRIKKKQKEQNLIDKT